MSNYGPMLSGDLARLYEKTYRTSNETARKAISRARPPVKRLSKFKFEKNQLFYYLEAQFMSERYAEALLKAIEEHSRVNYTYIQAFRSQNGYVSKKILPALVGAPIRKVKNHKMHSAILRSLIDARIITEFSEERYAMNQAFSITDNINRSIGLEIAKKVIINDFNSWARGVNLVSYEKGRGLFEEPEFAQFQWAYTAPSYIQPLYSNKEKQPGFVIADVFYGATATKESIAFFIDKLNIIRSYKNIKPFLPVLLTDKIDPEALKLLKDNKVMVAILNNFFSEKYTNLLNELVNTFANTTSIINKNPDMIYKLFDELAKSEGRYNNMSGDMFELLVGSFYAYAGCTSLKSKAIIRDDSTGRYKELDWLAEKDGVTVVVECKATKAAIDDDFISKWLSENIPFTRKWLIDNRQCEKIEFQIWSTGGFTDKALQLLNKAETETSKYSIKHFDREKMMSLAKEKNDKHFIEIMQAHFPALK
ncbi:MAG: hypothetical protein NC394_08515 [Bacteroides sp.]|nr:hypothetical protein [Bacteroides sp.]